MPTDFWFRFSTYLTLGLSCACLGYAEWELLPAVSGFAALVIVFLAVSFWLDRQVELGLGKANLLGLVIGILAALWMVYTVTNPPKTMAQLGWPTTLLPVIAPVLMVLIPAKLLRPKHVGDWWAMHGVALAAVGLAAALTDEAAFVPLLIAYSVTAAWSLVLFFYRRGGGYVPPIPDRPVQPPPQVLNPDLSGRGPRWMFARSTLWLIFASLIALPLFFVLPRPEGAAWLITKQTFDVGQSGEPTIDLNQGGSLQQTDEVAYILHPTKQSGEYKDDLPADQLWRARALCEYRDGAWSRPTTVPVVIPQDVGPVPPRTPEGLTTNPSEFGPDGFLIEFVPMEKERFPVLAAPVWWVPHKLPVYWVGVNGGWQRATDMSYIGHAPVGARIGRYRQACHASGGDGLGKPFEVLGRNGRPDVGQMTRKLDTRPGRGQVVNEYATTLLDQLIREGKLPPEAKSDNDPLGRTAPDYHERIARLFSDHLGGSGEFTYTTELVRKDLLMDPVEDFLKNTRGGNCELFATALVMLLRAVDVPAQYVTGYKGWETDEDGNVVIRRRQAHAWVEVLISRPPPPEFQFHADTPVERRTRVWHWLSLDPTTGEVAVTTTEQKSWLAHGTSFLLDLIIGYDKAKQQKAIQDALTFSIRYGPLLMGGTVALIVGRLLLRRWRRQVAAARHSEFAGPEWYARLLLTLEVLNVTPSAGETPREFADRAANEILALGLPADVPPFVTSKLYRVRYGGQAITPDELETVMAAVGKLEQAIRSLANGGGK